MPPAARVTDLTSHGTPLAGSGSFNVLIGGLPAWRALADFHTCPLTPPTLPPHVGGVVTIGSPTVFINNMPAARQGDMVVEAGPPNTITMGCPTVQIG
ncbi:PAAR domain-containing protein [Haladaptatus sp. NG-SE-30]